MKKIVFLFITLLFTLTLASCKKGKEINLSYDEKQIEVFVGDEVNVKPNVEVGKKVKSYELEYTLSSNIATVKDGILLAKEAGTVELTVVANNKDKSSTTLTIVIKEKEVVKNEYTITFNLDGGVQDVTEIKFKEDENVTLPTPTKEDYLFTGWYEGEVKIEKIENRNYNLVAKWIILPIYKINYSAPGAKMPSGFVTEFKHGEEVELPIPTKKGYEFKGWYENDILVEKLENRDYNLVAKFEKPDDGIYTISYRFIEGSWSNEDETLEVKYEYKFGDSFDLVPLVHPFDLIFVGWFDNEELLGEPITKILPTDKGDKVFYPKWREEYIPEKIESIGNITVDYNEEYQLTWEIYPIDASKKVRFESCDPSIASINQDGTITGHKYGKTNVKIISQKDDNIYALVEVFVSGDKATDFNVEDETITLKLGNKYFVSYEILPSTAYQGFDVVISDEEAIEFNNGFILAKKIGTYSIVLKTIDESNLSNTITINVEGDNLPVFSLSEEYEKNSTISWNQEIDILKDVRAFDNEDGELTNKIKITGEVDNRRYGEYFIEYYVEDSDGNFVTLTRTINVIWDYDVTVIGHAGSYYGVPNSEEAILYAAEVLKYPAIEIDLKQTKDGVFVLSHDPTWGNVVLEETNYADLKDVEYKVTKSAGIPGKGLSEEERTFTAKICTFERYLEICKEYNIISVIELKTSSGISNWTEANTPDKSRMADLMKIIEKYEMLERVVFLSSQELCLNWVKTNGYEYIPCQYLTLKSCANIDTYNIVKKYNLDISFNVRDGIKISDEWINNYKKLGCKLAVFTFEEYASYEDIQYWIDRGVDYVTTDWHVLDELELPKNN